MPEKRLLAIGLSALASTGCIRHEAVIHPPATPPAEATALIDDQAVAPWQETIVRDGSLPQEVPLISWYRDDDGRFHIGQTTATTSLPFWQRFPADLFTDCFWPGTLVIRSEKWVEYHAVEALSVDELDRLAATHPPVPEDP